MHFFLKNSLLASLALYAFVIVAFCVAIKFFGFDDPYLKNTMASHAAYEATEQVVLGNGDTDGLVTINPEPTPLGAIDTEIANYIKIRTAVVVIFAFIVSLGILINHLDRRKDEIHHEVNFQNDGSFFVVAV